MKVFVLFIGALGALYVINSPLALAEQSQFKVKILPMNCLFDVVDDGSNEITYLTPEACDQADAATVPLPPSESNPSPTTPSLVSQAGERVAEPDTPPSDAPDEQPIVFDPLEALTKIGDMLASNQFYVSMMVAMLFPMVLGFTVLSSLPGKFARLLVAAKDFIMP
jgi:hypothetical protein